MLQSRFRSLARDALVGSLALLAAACGQAAIVSPHSPVFQAATARPDLSLPPVEWAAVAAANEVHIVNFDPANPLRYRVRRVDAKGQILREIIESRQGPVARLLERNGQPLLATENSDERSRLQGMLDSPDSFLRRGHRDDSSKSYATELLQSMTKAMLWTYTPGQPQLPGAQGAAVVLDFKPNPAFHPSGLITEALTGVAGRVWVDGESHCVTRIEGRILHTMDFGWGGVLARVKEGGTVELDQRRASDHRWLFTHLVERLSIREVLFHNVEENVEMIATDVEVLPGPLSYREAIEKLLAIPVPTR